MPRFPFACAPEERVPAATGMRTLDSWQETCLFCAGCNNGWMSRHETSTLAALIPMINGERALLDWNAKRALAAWALKAASVADHAPGDPWQPTWMDAERRHLAEFGEPSAEVLVRLAARGEPPPAQI